MKETNLNVFFQFGMALESLNARVSIKETVASLFPWLYPAREWLYSFLRETESLKVEDSRATAGNLALIIAPILESLRVGDRQITQDEVFSFCPRKRRI
jgi:hypothetical protein